MTTTQIAQNAGKIVETTHVDALITNYKKQRWLHNSQHIGKPDSLSTWYGIAELNEFLAAAASHNADGVKMYYGVYPEGDEIPEGYAGRQTVVLVATKKSQTAAGAGNKDIYVDRDGISQILAFNFGTLCPPQCRMPGALDTTFSGVAIDKIGLTLLESEGQVIVV